ncbi:MAG: type IX secretion system membrane protein PorP/SprF [Bacteroidota bacterium]
MRKILLFLFVSVFFFPGNQLFSQDIHFTQYYANPVYLNPAFAGTGMCPRLILNYRNQWPAVAGTYISYSASYDQHVENLSGGIGLMFNADDAGEGTLKTNIISGIYSYRMQVNRYFSIKLAFQGSYFQKKLDWAKLTFNDMIDPKYGFVYNTNDKANRQVTDGADFSAGILAYGESFFGGFAVHHLTEPNESFIGVSKLPRKYTLHAGGIIELSHSRKRRSLEDPFISPNILFMKQQDFEQLNYGLYFNKYPLVGGLWFRQGFENPDAFIALLGIQTSVFKIGYSYDVTVSKLGSSTAGSHEVSMGFQFDCKPKKKRIRAINCPSF